MPTGLTCYRVAGMRRAFIAAAVVLLAGGPAHIPVDSNTMEPRTGDWPFWGWFNYCAEREPDNYPECEVPEITCQSTEHTLTIVKR